MNDKPVLLCADQIGKAATSDVTAILNVLNGKSAIYCQIVLAAAMAEFCENVGPRFGYTPQKYMNKMVETLRGLWAERAKQSEAA